MASDRSLFERFERFLPLIVFSGALILRILYDAVLLKFCVCSFGDALYFLTGGSDLVTGNLPHPSGARLDGWPYMLLLGPAARLFGVNASAPAFTDHCLQFSVLNAVLDSVTCLLVYKAGRLAFNRNVALTAAFIWMIYPPAVLATQFCYSETSTALLVSAWIYLSIKSFQSMQARKTGEAVRSMHWHWAGVGVISGLLVASKLALIAIPLIVAALLSALLTGSGRGAVENLVVVAFKMQATWSGHQFQKLQSAWSGSSNSAGTSGGYSLSHRASPLLVIALTLVGFLLAVVPFLLLTHASSGDLISTAKRLFVSRLYSGNNTEMGGWRIDGQPLPSTDEMPQLLVKSVVDDPLRFAAMMVSKVDRLWLAAWNPLQYSLPFLGPEQQEMLHQLLVFLAMLGLALLSAGHGHLISRKDIRQPTRIIVAVLACHCTFLLVDPCARNAFAAAPAIVLLSACACVILQRKAGMQALLRLAAFAILMIWLAHRLPQERAILSGHIPAGLLGLLPLLLFVLWLIALVWFWRVTLRAVLQPDFRQTLPHVVITAAFGAAALIFSVRIMVDPDRGQWSADIKGPRLKVRQDIFTPGLTAAQSYGKTSFLLVDLESMNHLPQIELSVNGTKVKNVPVPWLQLRSSGWTGEKSFLAQAKAMGVGAQTFRQWWAIPVPTDLLRYEASNEFVLSSGERDPMFGFRVMGDYKYIQTATSQGFTLLPSMDFKLSTEKGFETSAGADPRVWEKVRLLGQTADCFRFDGKNWRSDDLSADEGMQTGEYRIRLAIPLTEVSGTAYPKAAAWAGALLAAPWWGWWVDEGPQPVVMVSDTPIRGVAGNDPWSMRVISSPLKVPTGLPSGTQFYFGIELKDFDKRGTASVSVEFSGLDKDGKTVSWTSPWQPGCLHTDPFWTPISFVDVIPEKILRLKDLQVNVSAAPYHQDLLRLSPREAIARSVAIRNATLVLLPSYNLPPEHKNHWLLF